MDFQLPINIPALSPPITYRDKILLTGSCFTEHIGNRLQELKFSVLQNPHGILFDPKSVSNSLVACLENKVYTEKDLFYLHELWQSWEHHTQFSALTVEEALHKINASQAAAHTFLLDARYLVITLGSSFSYRLSAEGASASNREAGFAVANCHRAPSQWFEKHLMSIEETSAVLDNCLHRLFHANPSLHVIFTVSPVRHIRDGVIENNRSKARLIEVVHQLVNKFDKLYYFPAYELVIDVLRDYRFYDIDMVHPNYPATAFVMEKFMQACVDPASRDLMEEVKRIVTARKHKAFQPATLAHQRFLKTHLDKTIALQQQYPFLNVEDEIVYFSSGNAS